LALAFNGTQAKIKQADAIAEGVKMLLVNISKFRIIDSAS
jgi:hypothetical protein